MKIKTLTLAAVSVAALFLTTGAANAVQPTSPRFHIDFANDGAILGSDGQTVPEERIQGDDFESISSGHLADGSPLRITRHMSPPIPEEPPARPTISEAAVASAIRYQGTLPAELVGTEFVDGDSPQSYSRSIAPGPADSATAILTFVQAVSSDSLAASWEPAGEHYRVYRDGALVGDTAAPLIEQSGLTPGTEYTYSVETYAEDGTLAGSRTWTALTLSVNEKASRTVAPLTYQSDRSAAFHASFIADASVPFDDLVALGCGHYGEAGFAFKGDNRSYTAPQSIYYNGSARTSANAEVNWNGGFINYGAGVGSTTLLRYGNYYDQRTASPDGIQWSLMSVGPNFAQARVNVSVGNPFCASGPITTALTFRWYRTGTFEVVGSRLPVPHHEIYGGWQVGNAYSWHSMRLMPNQGFHCLTLPLCATEGISETRTY